jgi:uncharacterized protein YegP (UPF0339 family)
MSETRAKHYRYIKAGRCLEALSHARSRAMTFSQVASEREDVMAGWFELNKSKDEQFYFVLRAGNGEVVLTSEPYLSKASAENGITSVRENSPIDGRYVKKEAVDGRSYFKLMAANREIIGASQLYASMAGRDNGIRSVKENGHVSTIRDNT